jgi:hypothetical protein
MAYDIITIEPTVTDGDHLAADVVFNLTEVILPARACKLVNWSREVAAGGGEDNTKLAMLFFQKNTQATLGTLNDDADITAADFKSNKYIGSAWFGLADGNSALDLDVIETTALYYPSSAFSDPTPDASNFGSDSAPAPLVLKGDAGNSKVYVGMVVHAGSPDFDGTDTVRIHLHVEY